ncbi:MAG: hypothetical protein ACOCXG_01790 [Nanoarchaeota archaeon]
MYNKSKKGFSEITSFVLLVSLIITTSLIAYTFSSDLMESRIGMQDKVNMESYLKKVDAKISSITNFDGETTTINVNFEKGFLKFNSNQIFYYSVVSYGGEGIDCFDNFCYGSKTGHEYFHINLTSQVNFASNFTLRPGHYLLKFKYDKENEEVEITFK